MRILLTLALVAALAVVTFVLWRDDDEPRSRDTGAVTLVGDSLNVGIEPYLEDVMPGWRIDAHDRVGRTTSEGIEVLRELDGSLAPIVVVSLGTNDPDDTEEEFRALVEEALEIIGPGRCVVWATIVRDGAERAGFDELLRRASSSHANLRLVEWAELVANDESLLASDDVHGTPEGYERRAEETAEAIRACPQGQAR